MKFRNARILFYYSQYYKVTIGERLYKYDKNLDYFPLLITFFTLLKHSFITKKPKYFKTKAEYNNLVYLETINQKNAIIDLFDKAEINKKTLFIITNVINEFEYDKIYFNTKFNFFYSIFHIPKLFFLLFKYKKKIKGTISLAHLYTNLAVFISAKNRFKRVLLDKQIKKVILTNDHNLNNLALLLVAKELKIPSIYIQHAAVSKAFPKLIADFALLEGQQAEDVYKEIGNLSRKTILVGILRLDGVIGYKAINKSSDLVVGFCLKPYYSEELILNHLNAVKKCSLVKTIILRPHPGNTEDFYKRIENFGVEISNAKKERPHEFLKKIDVLISGESSIILEATLMKVRTIYIDDKFAQYDLYGFVKNKITLPVQTTDELTLELYNNSNLIEEQFKNAKYYCSTINTPYQNKSKELILKYI